MNRKKITALSICLFTFIHVSIAQKVLQYAENLQWSVISQGEPKPASWLSFTGAVFNDKLPLYVKTLPLDGDDAVTAIVTDEKYEPLTATELLAAQPYLALLPASVSPRVNYITENRINSARVSFCPIVKDWEGYKKLVSFTINISIEQRNVASLQSTAWADNSVLANGQWVKVSVDRPGIYILDGNYLSKGGLPVTGVDISTVRLYGNGGGMLPEANSAPRKEDLEENAIKVVDNNGNGKFDADDYILFYAEGPHVWNYNAINKSFTHSLNLYTDVARYFITVGAPGGKRIQSQGNATASANYTCNSFDELYYHESEQINAVKSTIKSGREWYGEEFDRTVSYDFPIDIPDLITADSIFFRSQAVARSASACNFVTKCNGQQIAQQGLGGISFEYDSPFLASPYTVESRFLAPSSPLTINYTFNKGSSSIGWLNFFELQVRRRLNMSGSQLIYRDTRSAVFGNVTEFTLQGNSNPVTVWDITDKYNVKDQQVNVSGSTIKYTLNTDQLRSFIAFNNSGYLQPMAIETVGNQNLHAVRDVDMVIITHPDFMDEAERLAKHHRDHDNLDVYITTPQKLYNEFSSGVQDISAIRNFMKMLYDKASAPAHAPKYLLLFGDASYDYKDRVKNNTNFIPTYESYNSYSPTDSYCSDDYYGHLDDNEGSWADDELLDIGIGRLPVQTAEQARQMVDKMINYTKSAAFGEWRNNVCLIADDEDFNEHFTHTEEIGALMDSTYENYNLNKIYLDSYKEISVGNGNRYPQVNDALNRQVAKGALIINYTGHGGEQGLAHESILDVPMINAWKNTNNLPLFITATCEFSRFDDPARTSAGELVLLNPIGGGIGLLTTVRLVFSGPNAAINQAFYISNGFEMQNGQYPKIGDVFKRTKNNSPGLNSRNFTFLGDPALTLAYPKYRVSTLSINGKPAGGTDTTGALSKVTIKGQVEDLAGNKMTSFNGIVYPVIFDKKSTMSTLANDLESYKANFSQYKNIIYKGKTSVNSGEFEFSFIVPKDISYADGFGKISYYANNSTTDANGSYENLVIKGSDKAATPDVQGPTVRVYMNDTTFRFGGITGESPTLVALVSDLHGINTTGNGIGRDITAVLDGDRNNMFTLNDYYQAKLDSYQDGEIHYPLSNLADGRHNIKVKVWDVYNNSAEGYTEFIVAKSEKLAIKNLMNYPNPFDSKTRIYFEHNQTGKELRVAVSIYTLDGRLVKMLSTQVVSGSANFDELEWSPGDEHTDILKAGVYMFRVRVTTPDGQMAEESEKMVYIRQ